MKPLFRSSCLPSAGALLLLAVACLPAQTPPAAPPPVQLSALVAEISARNPELAFYEAEIAAAKAGRRAATAQNDPEIALDLGRKRVKDPTGALAGSGAAWSVSVTQTFEWPGRLALRKAIANRNLEIAELGLARFRHALAARARTLAYTLQAAHTEAAAVREVAGRFTALKETFLAREPAGVTPLLETRVIEASELAIQRRATDAELAVQAALIALNQLRGAAAGAPLRLASARLALHDAPPIETLLTAARENNFDYRMRRLELEQQGFQVQLARNERYPALSVRPFLSQENAGDRETTVGVGLSVPLPVGGRSRGAVDVAEARRRQAEAAALVAERELEKDVVTAAHAFATKLAESRRWDPDAAQKFREAAELADRHYRLGAVPIATYVELQTSYLDAVTALLATQREALEAGLKLQQLTGLDFNAVEVAP
jgi:cobalt-zinc-cadmium efflux system outer membrane protein